MNSTTSHPTIKTMLSACALLIAIGSAGVAKAEDDRGISVTGKISTLGLGAELKYPFHEKFNGRLVFNKYSKSYVETDEGNRYVGDLELNTFGLVGDWHPTGGGFRLSLGLLSNDNELGASTEDMNYEYNNRQYTGRANVLVDFKSFAPYFGLGWSSQKKRGLSVDFEVGALFQDTPMLSASGFAGGEGSTCNFTIDTDGVATVTGSPLCAANTSQTDFKNDIKAEHGELQDGLDNFKIYPVLSLGIQYRF